MSELSEAMASWGSYPSIYALGHKAIEELLLDPVTVEEKIDGSQFSFGRFVGELRARSKGAQLNVIAPEKMFSAGVEAVSTLDLHDGWAYRCEYLSKPKHNSLCYDRIPNHHVILFDVTTGPETYLTYGEKASEAERIGLEVVPLIHEGPLTDIQVFRGFLDRESVLGGQKVEGVVVKNYSRFGRDKKVLMGKFVSEAFKEVHAKEWRESNPTKKDLLERLIAEYQSPARWQKALQHMRDAGLLENSPRDIGLIIKEVPDDIRKECEAEIRDKLFAYAWPKIARGVTRGLPEWYKEKLLVEQFGDDTPVEVAVEP